MMEWLKILKFADDTKIVSKVKVGSDVEMKALHSDLQKMFEWCRGWQIVFFIYTQ